MRVLHAVASIGDTYGGVSAAVHAMGRVERAAGHDASLITVDRPEQGGSIRAACAEDFELTLLPPGRVAGRWHGGRGLAEQLRTAVRAHDLVVVHGVFDLVAELAARAASRAGVPYLLWPHGSLDPYDLRKHRAAKRALAPLWRNTVDGAQRLLCTTGREAEQLVTFGAGTRRAVLPLPVPDPGPLPSRPIARLRNGISPDANVVLFLGRIDEKKGLPLLLRAFGAAAGERDVLVLAGGGDPLLAERLRRMADELPRGRVLFTGWVGAARRREMLAAADVFALLSDNENFGIAVAEALHAKVPTLLSDQVYLGDDLAADDATMRCRRDVASAADALRHLLSDEVLRRRIAAAGRSWVRRELAVHRVADDYRELTSEVMSGCRPSAC